MSPPPTSVAVTPSGLPKKKPISYSNLLLGAALNMFEYVFLSESHANNRVTTLGQPFEVLKVQLGDKQNLIR